MGTCSYAKGNFYVNALSDDATRALSVPIDNPAASHDCFDCSWSLFGTCDRHRREQSYIPTYGRDEV